MLGVFAVSCRRSYELLGTASCKDVAVCASDIVDYCGCVVRGAWCVVRLVRAVRACVYVLCLRRMRTLSEAVRTYAYASAVLSFRVVLRFRVRICSTSFPVFPVVNTNPIQCRIYSSWSNWPGCFRMDCP